MSKKYYLYVDKQKIERNHISSAIALNNSKILSNTYTILRKQNQS